MVSLRESQSSTECRVDKSNKSTSYETVSSTTATSTDTNPTPSPSKKEKKQKEKKSNKRDKQSKKHNAAQLQADQQQKTDEDEAQPGLADRASPVTDATTQTHAPEDETTKVSTVVPAMKAASSPRTPAIGSKSTTATLRRSVTAGAAPPRPPFLNNPYRQHHQPSPSSGKATGQQLLDIEDASLRGCDGDSISANGSVSPTRRRSSSKNIESPKRSSSMPSQELAAALQQFGESESDFLAPPPSTEPLTKLKKMNTMEHDTATVSDGEFTIEIGTPADMALRASAEVKVSRLDKMSRKLQIPHAIHAVKKTSSSLAHVGLKGKKPPRIPNFDDATIEGGTDLPIDAPSLGAHHPGGVNDDDHTHTSDMGPVNRRRKANNNANSVTGSISPSTIIRDDHQNARIPSTVIRGVYSADDADDVLTVTSLTSQDRGGGGGGHILPDEVNPGDTESIVGDGIGIDPVSSASIHRNRPADNFDGSTMNEDDPGNNYIWRCASDPSPKASPFRGARNGTSSPCRVRFDKDGDGGTSVLPSELAVALEEGTTVVAPTGTRSQPTTPIASRSLSLPMSTGSKKHRRNKTDSSYLSGKIDRPKQATSLRSITTGPAGLRRKKHQQQTEGNLEASGVTPESIVKKPYVYKRSKKRKGDPSMRKSYVKGKVIDGQHELYALSIAVMFGLRTSIGKTNSELALSQQHRLKARSTAKRETTSVAYKHEDIFPRNGGGVFLNPNAETAENMATSNASAAAKVSRNKLLKLQRRKNKKRSSSIGVSESITLSVNSAKAWLNNMTPLPGFPLRSSNSIEMKEFNKNEGSSHAAADADAAGGAVAAKHVAVAAEVNGGDDGNEDSDRDATWLDSDDFMAVEKYVFHPEGGPNTPPHKLSHTFKFKDYSPKAFAYIRRLFGINEYEFLSSVCGNASFIEFISNAKSGQFFFYSSDGKYMIKTMTTTESKFLRRILPHYFRHCAQSPDTLITKFFGMYRVKLYHLRRNVKFVIMNSVFDTDKYISSFFDVKGSKLGRDAKPGEMVKKDNDIRKTLPEEGFIMNDDVRSRMRAQIIADCHFLEQMKIMDYSMLIGVHRIPASKQEPSSPQRTRGRGSFSRGGKANLPSQTADASFPTISQSYSHEECSIRNMIGERSKGMKKGTSSKDVHAYDVALEANQFFHTDKSHGAAMDTTSTGSSKPNNANNEEISGDASVLTEDTRTENEMTNIQSTFAASGGRIQPVITTHQSSNVVSSNLTKPSCIHASKRGASDSGPSSNMASFRGVTDDLYYELEEDESSFLEGSNAQMDRSSTGPINVAFDFSSTAVSVHDNCTGGRSSRRIMVASEPSIRNIQLENPLAVSPGQGTTLNCGSGNVIIDPVEIRKELATEQMYWPFHRFYNIQGWRRMESLLDEGKPNSTSLRPSNNQEECEVDSYGVPLFVRPISDRKDKGLTMNAGRMKVILEANANTTGAGGDLTVQPKIFYMGIIDVLQQFNLRKRVEAKIRRAQGGGWADASCVHPDVYATRFLEFFDEYTLAKYISNGHVRIDEEDDSDQSHVSYEQIIFSKGEGSDEETQQKSKSKKGKCKDKGKETNDIEDDPAKKAKPSKNDKNIVVGANEENIELTLPETTEGL